MTAAGRVKPVLLFIVINTRKRTLFRISSARGSVTITTPPIAAAQLTDGAGHMNKHDLDNYSNQLNPEHDAYWQSRGEEERPDDWEDRFADSQGDEK